MLELLSAHGLNYTIGVFLPEVGTSREALMNRSDLLTILKFPRECIEIPVVKFSYPIREWQGFGG